MNLTDLLDKASALLKDEPARVIGYGAAVIVFLVAKASGSIEDIPFDQTVVMATAAIATVTTVIETIRHLVTPVAKLAPAAGNPDDINVDAPGA
jgi:hypothetical protein